MGAAGLAHGSGSSGAGGCSGFVKVMTLFDAVMRVTGFEDEEEDDADGEPKRLEPPRCGIARAELEGSLAPNMGRTTPDASPKSGCGPDGAPKSGGMPALEASGERGRAVGGVGRRYPLDMPSEEESNAGRTWVGGTP